MSPRATPRRKPAARPKARKKAAKPARTAKAPRRAGRATPATRQRAGGKPAKPKAVARGPRKPAKATARGGAKPAARPSSPRAAPDLVEFEPFAPQAVEAPPAPRPSKPLRIALFGASGLIGSRIAKEALARGHRVTALVRHPEKVSLQHANLKALRGDATDPLQVAAVGRSHDVVASAIAPPLTEPAVLSHAASALVEGARETGRRVVAVGGAGGLEVAPGKKLLDSDRFPYEWRPIARAHDQALEVFRRKGDGVAWTVVSPSAVIEPGERTGRFRLGTDRLLADAKGESRISTEDYAVAFVDELENGANPGRRITVGY